LLDPDRVVACFVAYMKHEKLRVTRAGFERNLTEKETDSAFQGDTRPLLAAGVDYNAKAAIAMVREVLISRLPGKPWRGPSSARGADADAALRNGEKRRR